MPRRTAKKHRPSADVAAPPVPPRPRRTEPKPEPEPTPDEAGRKRPDPIQTLRSRLTGAHQRSNLGVLVTGRPGVGKTTTVRETLAGLDPAGDRWRIIGGTLTAAGFLEELAATPDHTIVCDDLADTWKDARARQYLIQACDTDTAGGTQVIRSGSAGGVRVIHWTGRIVIIQNGPLPDTSDGRAVASRLQKVAVDPSDGDLAEKMLGWARTDDERAAVRYAVDLTADLSVPLTLRHGALALADYRQWRAGDAAGMHWRDLVASSIRASAPPTTGRGSSGDERRRAVWTARTQHRTIDEAAKALGMSVRTFNRDLSAARAAWGDPPAYEADEASGALPAQRKPR